MHNLMQTCIGIDIIFRNLLKKDDGENNLPYLNYKSYGKGFET